MIDTKVRVDAPDTDLGENVFQVLARNARGRSRVELRATAFACGVNAGFLWWSHPSLSWLASGFTAGAAYALWGLLDRASTDADVKGIVARGRAAMLREVQPLLVIAGTSAAFWALFRFMAAALGGWQH
jgi:hypothetical protein